MMSADDFFTLKRYKGDIYKAVNLQDRLLSNYCTDNTEMKAEQQRIEKQLTDVQEHVYGRDSAYYARLRADSLAQAEADSIAALGKSARNSSRRSSTVTTRRTTTSRRTSTRVSTSTSKPAKPAKTKAPRTKSTSPKSSGGGLSVRRQRH